MGRTERAQPDDGVEQRWRDAGDEHTVGGLGGEPIEALAARPDVDRQIGCDEAVCGRVVAVGRPRPGTRP